MFDVLALCQFDWANTAYKFCQCLQTLGINVIGYKGQPHEFNYVNQLPIHLELNKGIIGNKHPLVVFAPGMKGLVEKAKVVHFFASTFIETGVDLSNKKIIAQHGGTTYRLDPKASNEVFNPMVTATIIQYPTLLNKGAKNEHLIYYPVDTNFIQPDFERKGKSKLIVGHFPSTCDSKGTETIVNVMDKLKDKFEYIGVRKDIRIDWLNNLERVNKCDILIETIKPELMGKEFGSWGNACLEAAALGKIVITNDNYQDIYKREYGNWFEPMIANDGEQLEQRLLELYDYMDKEIFHKKQASREWVVQCHSISVTAERLWDKAYQYLNIGRK